MTDFHSRVVEAMARAIIGNPFGPDSEWIDMTIAGHAEKWWLARKDDAARALTALLSELDAAGFGVKPLVATERMMADAWEPTPEFMEDMTDRDFGQSYAAMIAAAPDPFKEPGE